MKEINFGLLCLVFLDEVYRWIVSLGYVGWPGFRILYVIRPILNCTLYLTGSQ